MTIYIELLVVFAIIFMIIVWAVWNKVSKFIIKRRYKKEDDKGWLGEEHRKELIQRRIRESTTAITKSIKSINDGIVINEGQGTSSTGTDIPTANADVPREDSSSTRKGNGFRKFFRRKR